MIFWLAHYLQGGRIFLGGILRVQTCRIETNGRCNSLKRYRRLLDPDNALSKVVHGPVELIRPHLWFHVWLMQHAPTVSATHSLDIFTTRQP
jgi:hypothetical protein